MWKGLALLWSHLFIFVFVSCVWESHENTHFPNSVPISVLLTVLYRSWDRSFFFFDLFWFLRWKSNFTFLKIECLISPALCELVLFKLLYYVYGGLPVCMVVHHTNAWSPGGRKWVSELLERELWSVVSHHGRAACVLKLDPSPQPHSNSL